MRDWLKVTVAATVTAVIMYITIPPLYHIMRWATEEWKLILLGL